MIQLDTPEVSFSCCPPVQPLYFEPISGRYFVLNDHGEWMGVGGATAETYIVSLGHSRLIPKGESMSDAEHMLLRIQLENSVHYAGPLAGYKIGPHTIGPTRVLVTKSVKPVDPAPGTWPVVGQLLNNLFGPLQLEYVYGWTKQTLAMLRSGKQRPGQAFVVCGPPGAGKSLLGELFTVLFGGEPGHPWKYMNDKTQFNSDLFGSVLLVADDEAESFDIRVRRAFGANIKKIVAVKSHPCHKKYSDQISLRPLWRLMIMLNDDPERLMVLPPLDEDIEGKLMIFKVEAREMPMRTDTPEEADEFMETMVSELPAFVHFLDGWMLPTAIEDPRFGVRSFHHRDIARDIELTTPQERLKEMIDEVIFSTVKAARSPVLWEGRAAELYRVLTDKDSTCSREAEKLLAGGRAVCGKYLGRLEKQEPTRFSHRLDQNTGVWTIQPPAGMSKAKYPPFSEERAAEVRAASASKKRENTEADSVLAASLP
jgi:hypothetical protein